MTSNGDLLDVLFVETLRDTHAYIPGLEPRIPTLSRSQHSGWRGRMRTSKEYARDLLERLAISIGFAHRHFDPALSGQQLARLVELRNGLQETYDRLADEPSRRALLDVLKLRVLGAPHARLAVTPQEFRKKQEWLNRERRVESSTFVVSDPWFSPLSRYSVPLSGAEIDLHAHSVDIVSVFLLEQYSYRNRTSCVSAQQGDTVLDVGGCWGDSALYFAHQVGPHGRVFTFEFDPESLSVLRANLALNPDLASRIEVVELALWNRSGEKLMFNQAGRCTSVSRPSVVQDGAHVKKGGLKKDGLHVKTITLDDFLREAGISRVDFVKLDVEGSELNVLEGASKCFARFRPNAAIAAYHRDDDLVNLPKLLQRSATDYEFFLGSYSPLEEETVLFARATDRNSSTYRSPKRSQLNCS
jgi:FkbM family methyltransferase